MTADLPSALPREDKKKERQGDKSKMRIGEARDVRPSPPGLRRSSIDLPHRTTHLDHTIPHREAITPSSVIPGHVADGLNEMASQV